MDDCYDVWVTPRKRLEHACEKCGEGELHFEELPSGKFWLFDRSGEPHKCPISPEGRKKLEEFGL